MNNTVNITSTVNIEYKNGFFQVYELTTPISKHKTLSEAQWIKSVLDAESNNSEV